MKNRINLTRSDIHILIVDDDHVNQFITGKLLQEYGFDYCIASSGAEALQMISEKEFQIVLMDMDMPEMDGCETTRYIRSMSDTYFKTIPILLFSYSSCFTSLDEVTRMGMTDIAEKPLSVTDLENKIFKYLFPNNH